jgi:hypothetical protein
LRDGATSGDTGQVKLALALLMVTAGTARAEVEEKGVILGGVFTGLNHDNQNMGGGGSKPSIGPSLGAFVVLNVSSTFAIQLEGRLDIQRFELHESSDMQIGNAEAFSFELPALARIQTGDNTKAFLIGGPSLVVLAGGEVHGNGFDSPYEGMESFNIALSIGAGVETIAGPGRIGINARYRHAFLPFSDAAIFGDPEGETTQKHMIQVFVTYGFL